MSEEMIHRKLISWSREIPLLKKVIIHIPNEGKRSPRYAARLKAMGMRPGVSDLFIALGRHGYHGAWIELKSCKGKVSIKQQKFIEDMNEQNYYTTVCYSLETALEKIKWYCFGDN